MTGWIIDASVAMNWFLTDENDRQYSIAVFDSLGDREILVPCLWLYEVANVLIVAQRRSRMPVGRVHEVLELIADFNLAIDPVSEGLGSRLIDLALRHNLTVYDAAYLDLAIRSSAPIATKDKALLQAMQMANVDRVQPIE